MSAAFPSPVGPVRAWAAVLLCMVAYIFSFIDRQILALLIGPIQRDLGLSDTQFGLLHGFAFALFYALLGIPVAALSDRGSRPLIISVGVALWSLATMACGLGRSFLHLFLARVCVGGGEAALSPATYSLIGDMFPRERLGRAVAVYSLGSFLGTGIAFLLGGWLITRVGAAGPVSLAGLPPLAGWQLTFLIVGAPGLLLALVMGLAMPEPRSGGGGLSAASAPGVGEVLRFLWRERAIFGPHMAGFTLAAMTLFALLSWSPAYLMRSFGMSPAQSGAQLGVVAILGAGGGVMASGWLMDRLTRAGRRDAPFMTGMLGAAGAALPLLLLPFVAGPGMALSLLAVAFFFASFPMPPSTAVMQVVAPSAMRSRVSALFLGSNSLIGMGGGGALVGLVTDRVLGGPAATGQALGMVGGLAALGALAVLALGRGPMRRFVAHEAA